MSKTNGKGHHDKRGFTYRSYSFVDKDPVIDRMRTLYQRSGLSYHQIGIISGVSGSTLHNWFEGQTRRPQFATVAAFASSLGYAQTFKKKKQIDYEKELEKAKAEIAAASSK